ncbi:hypothetical protein M9458_057514, partial [Cirrhinus mrigala]
MQKVIEEFEKKVEEAEAIEKVEDKEVEEKVEWAEAIEKVKEVEVEEKVEEAEAIEKNRSKSRTGRSHKKTRI